MNGYSKQMSARDATETAPASLSGLSNYGAPL